MTIYILSFGPPTTISRTRIIFGWRNISKILISLVAADGKSLFGTIFFTTLTSFNANITRLSTSSSGHHSVRSFLYVIQTNVTIDVSTSFGIVGTTNFEHHHHHHPLLFFFFFLLFSIFSIFVPHQNRTPIDLAIAGPQSAKSILISEVNYVSTEIVACVLWR